MKNYFVVVMVLGCALAASAANAQNVKQYIQDMKPLAIHYGANTLSLSNHELMITKGHVGSEVAGSSDGISVFIKQDVTWQLVRIDNKSKNQTVFWSVPHTGEDVIASIKFLISQDQSKLYVLEARKDYKTSLAEAAPVHFTLYQLKKAEDFDVYYFMSVAHEVSKRNYINADVAFRKEFNLE
jgi:hypothetical protein